MDQAQENALNILNKSQSIVQEEAQGKADKAHIFHKDASQHLKMIDSLISTSNFNLFVAQAPSLHDQANDFLDSIAQDDDDDSDDDSPMVP